MMMSAKTLFAEFGLLRCLHILAALLVIIAALAADGSAPRGSWSYWASVMGATLSAMLVFSLPLDITMSRVFMLEQDPATQRRYRRVIVVESLVWLTLLAVWLPYVLKISKVLD